MATITTTPTIADYTTKYTTFLSSLSNNAAVTIDMSDICIAAGRSGTSYLAQSGLDSALRLACGFGYTPNSNAGTLVVTSFAPSTDYTNVVLGVATAAQQAYAGSGQISDVPNAMSKYMFAKTMARYSSRNNEAYWDSMYDASRATLDQYLSSSSNATPTFNDWKTTAYAGITTLPTMPTIAAQLTPITGLTSTTLASQIMMICLQPALLSDYLLAGQSSDFYVNQLEQLAFILSFYHAYNFFNSMLTNTSDQQTLVNRMQDILSEVTSQLNAYTSVGLVTSNVSTIASSNRSLSLGIQNANKDVAVRQMELESARANERISQSRKRTAIAKFVGWVVLSLFILSAVWYEIDLGRTDTALTVSVTTMVVLIIVWTWQSMRQFVFQA